MKFHQRAGIWLGGCCLGNPDLTSQCLVWVHVPLLLTELPAKAYAETVKHDSFTQLPTIHKRDSNRAVGI